MTLLSTPFSIHLPHYSPFQKWLCEYYLTISPKKYTANAQSTSPYRSTVFLRCLPYQASEPPLELRHRVLISVTAPCYYKKRTTRISNYKIRLWTSSPVSKMTYGRNLDESSISDYTSEDFWDATFYTWNIEWQNEPATNELRADKKPHPSKSYYFLEPTTWIDFYTRLQIRHTEMTHKNHPSVRRATNV